MDSYYQYKHTTQHEDNRLLYENIHWNKTNSKEHQDLYKTLPGFINIRVMFAWAAVSRAMECLVGNEKWKQNKTNVNMLGYLLQLRI